MRGGKVSEVWTEEAAERHAKHEGRSAVMVYAEPDGKYTAYYDDGSSRGHKIVGSNPFMLDSMLSEAGAPSPRNLYLIGEDLG